MAVADKPATAMVRRLYGGDDLSRTLMITNASGWDTDCNSGNAGCILAIKEGLKVFDDGRPWRAMVADRMYVSSADGGRAVTDALQEAYGVVAAGRALRSLAPERPKGGARYSFALPGSTQGWRPRGLNGARMRIEHVAGHGERGASSLRVHLEGLRPGEVARVGADTFIPPDALSPGGYGFEASPSLHGGQRVAARGEASPSLSSPVEVAIYMGIGRTYAMELRLRGTAVEARVDGEQVFAIDDLERPLTSGAIGLLVDEGRADVDRVDLGPCPA